MTQNLKLFILIVVILGLSVVLSGCKAVEGQAPSQVDVKSDYEYYIDDAGTRIYEFTPKSSDNYSCLLVVGNGKRSITCFPKNQPTM